MRRGPISLAVLLACGCLLAPAAGAARPTPHRPIDGPAASADLWATVNKCDTRAAPDTIGVRGSMPGLQGQRTVAWMRFRVQFRRASDGGWQGAGAATGWQRIGTTDGEVLESGHDFEFEPPAAGGRHVLRGVVDFRWTRRATVLKRASRITGGGHDSSAGSDPAGFSAGLCVVR